MFKCAAAECKLELEKLLKKCNATASTKPIINVQFCKSILYFGEYFLFCYCLLLPELWRKVPVVETQLMTNIRHVSHPKHGLVIRLINIRYSVNI